MKAVGIVFAVACSSLAAHAQQPPAASRATIATDCRTAAAGREARMAELARSREEVEREAARLAAETEGMEAARRRAQAAGPAQVAAYNARRAEHARRVAAHNDRVAALNAEVERFNAESDEAVARCDRSLRLHGAQEPALDADERAVLAAAVASILPFRAANVMLEDHTATFLCSRSLPDVIRFDGCSGMRRADESARDVIAKLERAWPGVSAAALADLAAKGEMRARVPGPLAMPARQFLRGYGEGGPSGHVDASIKVSRVGFDPARREAVAFVAVRSKERSSAEYVRLQRAAGGDWTVVGRVPVR